MKSKIKYNDSNINNKNNEQTYKPLYYNDYYVTDITDVKEDNCISIRIFILLLTIFIFIPSVIDICYSYIDIDYCQKLLYFSSLNDWLTVNGIFGLLYYFFIIIIIFAIKNNTYIGYTKLINDKYENDKKYEIFCKVCSTFITLFMLLISSIGCYIFFSYFCKYCKSYTITIYMYIRLITQVITSICLIIFINY